MTKEKAKLLFENIYWKYVGIVILLLFPLRHVNRGIDLWDTGYNCSNFVYMGLDNMDSMWLFSTYLANVFGHMLTVFPGGKTLLGLNIYTGLLLGIMAVVSYLFLTSKLHFSKGVVFAGELIALCIAYSPSVILYNELTYVFFIGAIMLLFIGLTEDRMSCLVLAGICLGLNIFVRFSNLPQAGMILAVWLYVMWYKKGKFSVLLKYTLFCLVGYVIAVVGMLAIINSIYGVNAYFDGVMRLFGMSSNGTSGYSVFWMLTNLLSLYFDGIKRLAVVAVFIIIGIAAYSFLDKKGYGKNIKYCVMALICALMLAVQIILGFFRLNFWSYSIMYYPTVAIITLISIICVFIIFSRERSAEEKLFATMIFLQMMLSSVGSNTGMSAAMNSMYLSLPLLAIPLKSVPCLRDGPFVLKSVPVNINYVPVACVAGFFLLTFIIQTVVFGTVYVYEEGYKATGSSAYVYNNPVLKGIKMSDERAEDLQGISDYIYAEGLNGHEAITFGYSTSLSFYMELPPAFNSWPDLDSYDIEIMKEEMAKTYADADAGITDKPLIVIDKIFLEKLAEFDTAMAKLDVLNEYEADYNYVTAYENNRFIVMR